MADPFAGKVVIITGASSGIGKAMAVDLAKQGAKVGLLARRADLLDALAHEIRGIGGQASVASADVTQWEPTRDGIRKIESQLGPTDLMIANAGLGIPTPLDAEGHARAAGDTMRINVIGVIHALAAVIPGMIERKNGHLVAISSMAAYLSLPGESAYCASKAAVNSYMSGLRTQLRPKGIKVMTICPGFIATPMTAKNDFHMPGLLSAEVASQRMLKALASGKEIYNFPWSTLQLIRLAMWMPEWVLRKTAGTYKEKAV